MHEETKRGVFMEMLRTMMLNIIVLLFFATVLDLLLPGSSFRGYIKMAMGFFTVLTMLQPAVQILHPDDWESAKYKAVQTGQMVMAEAQNNMYQIADTAYAEQYRAQMEEQYAAQTARQIEALLMLTDYAVSEVTCQFVSADNTDMHKKLQICIEIGEMHVADSKRIQQAISDFFGLDVAQVQIREQAGR